MHPNQALCAEWRLCRLRGELLLRQAAPDALQAEECFHQALALAHRQEAKSLELRATMSLCRLWQQRKSGESRQLLAEVCTRFTEGFDTADLREARALLTALTGRACSPLCSRARQFYTSKAQRA